MVRNLSPHMERSFAMRNIILLPLLASIGLGFCLALNINLTIELMETREQLARAQSERQALEAQYQTLVQANNDLAAQSSALSAANADLQRQLATIQTECQRLSEQVLSLQSQVALFRRVHPVLDSLASASGKQLAAVLLLPVVPISLAVAYLRKHIGRSGGRGKRNGPTNAPNTYQVALTCEELDWLERRRRA
jgi:septal ring factor EnvC (AmiA/AmiB activator)